MKKILFLAVIFVLFTALTPIKAIDIQTNTASLSMCGNKQNFRVAITNNESAALSNKTLVIAYSLTGLYAFDPLCNHAGVIVSTDKTSLTIAINSLPIGETALITFDAQAGCNVPPILNQSTINASLIVTEGNQTISSSMFTVLESTNGTLVQNDTPIISATWEVSAALGENVIRKFRFQNTAPNAFLGVIKFSDIPNSVLNSAFSITKINLVFPDATIQTIQADAITRLNQTILPNEFLVIEETIHMDKCVELAEMGLSRAKIKIGCLAEELCAPENNFNLTINKSLLVPDLRMVGNYNRIPAYQSCYGETNYSDASIVFKNFGLSVAEGVQFSFIPAHFYNVDVGSFHLNIYNENNVLVSSGNIIYNHPRLSGESDIYAYDHNSNEVNILNYYRDIILNSSSTYAYGGTFDFKSVSNGTCSGISEYLASRVISHYEDASNLQHQINLPPNYSVKISWRDKHCCFPENFISNPYQNIFDPVIRYYLKDCNNNYKGSDWFTGGYNFNINQTIEPYSVILNGNKDKCLATKDGDFTEINLQNKIFAFQPDNSIGNLIVDLEIEPGVDLDLTLGGQGLDGNYNSTTCGFGNCSSICTAPTWPANDKYRIQFISDIKNLSWPASSISLLSSTTAGKTYRIVFDENILSNLLAFSGDIGGKVKFLNSIIKDMRLNFFVRSDCPAPPTTRIFETIGFSPTSSCMSGCIMNLYKKDFHFTVVCPGCITPGGNILSETTFERDTPSLGLIDETGSADGRQDGIPDGNQLITKNNLKLNCSNGDLMSGIVSVMLSDGEGNSSIGSLNTAEIYLDNLYLRIEPKDHPILEPRANGVTTVSMDGITWNSVQEPLIYNGTTIIVHVKASDLGIANFNGEIGRTIFVRFEARIKNENIINNNPLEPYPVYIHYDPYFSDCDNCITSSNDWTFKDADDAKNSTCSNWNPITTCMPRNRMFWQCSSGESMVNIIPVATQMDNIEGGNGSCKQSIDLNFRLKTYGMNAYPNEYRTFIPPNIPINFTAPLPNGYKISEIIISNYGNPEGLTLTKNNTDVFTLIGDAEIASALANNLFSISNNVFSIDIQAIPIVGGSSLGDRNRVTYTGQKIRMRDDYSALVVSLTFEPINCSVTPDDSYYGINLNKQGYNHLVDPSITLPLLPNSNAGIYPIEVRPQVGGFVDINKPNTNLSSSPKFTNIQLHGTRYFVPVIFDNSDPLDVNGNNIYTANHDIIRSAKAYFPFIKIKDGTDSGIKIIGVYKGELNANSSIPTTNYYNGLTKIANLNSDGGVGYEYIAENTRGQYYTVVVEYDCATGGCDTILPNCNSQFPQCLLTPKDLLMEYGWNCSGYPQNDAEVAASCFRKDMEVVHLITNPVAITNTVTINNGAPVQSCQDFPYTIYVKSCQNGSLNYVDATIDIPTGLQLVSTSPKYDLSVPGKIIIRDIKDGPFNLNDEKYLTLTFRASNTMAQPLVITTTLTGKTYCSSDIFETMTNSLSFSPLLSGVVDNQTVCLNTPDLLITPVMSGGTFTVGASLVVSNNNGQYIFNPQSAGVGNHDLLYTVASSGCLSTETITIQVVSTLVARIDSKSGGASFLCSSNSVLGIDLVATPSGAASYRWSFSVSNNPYNYSLLATTTDTHNATNAGFYQVEVIPSVVGCGNTFATYEVINDVKVAPVLPVCKGDNPPIVLLSKASGNPVIGTYEAQWYDYSTHDLQSDGIVASGTYYAVAIGRPDATLPSCTLSTYSDPSVITIKKTPDPYSISIDGVTDDFVLYCPSATNGIALLVNNSGENGSYSNPLSIVWNNSAQTSYPNNPSGITVNTNGHFTLTAQDQYTGCVAVSNELIVGGPHIYIEPTCSPSSSSVTLNVISNYPSTPGEFSWKQVQNPGASPFITSLGTGSSKVVSDPAILYTVEGNYQGCPTGDGLYLPSPIPFNLSGSSMNQIVHGDFVLLGGADCSAGYVIDFNTDFSCQANKNADPLDKLGHFMINGSADANGASLWNNSWTGFAHNADGLSTTGNEFLLVDGIQSAGAKLIWNQTISVSHAQRYFARAHIRNIDLFGQLPVRALPEVYMVVQYKGQNTQLGNPLRNQGQVLQSNTNGTDPWIEFGLFSLADIKSDASPFTTGEALEISISFYMKGSGAIGRDIGFDDVELWPIGLCDDLHSKVSISPCTGISIANPEQLICPGGSATVTINQPGPGVTYGYRELKQSSILPISLDPSNSFVVTPPANSTVEHYLLVATGAGCTTTMAFEVRTIKPPKLTISDASPANTCTNTTYAVKVDGSQNTTLVYLWKVNGNIIVGQTADVFTSSTQLMAGTVLTCEIQNYSFCATTTSPIAVYTVASSPFTANAGADKSVCLGSSVQIGTVPVSGYTYEWRLASPIIPNPNAPISSNSIYTVSPSITTSYELTVQDAATGCIAKDEIEVKVNALPNVFAGNDFAICLNSMATLNGSGAQTYSWDNGVLNNTSFTPSATNSYTVTGIDANGCSNIDHVIITVYSLPAVSAGADFSICKNSTALLNASGAQTYLWNNGVLNNQLFTPTVTNTYVVTGTDANGCSSTDDVVITVYSLPNVSAGTAKTVCANSYVTLAGSGAQTYTWDNGIFDNQQFVASGTKTYTVTGTDLNGCKDTATVEVTVKPNPANQITTTPITICNNLQANIGYTTSPGIASIEYPLPAGVINSGGTGGPGYAVQFLTFSPVLVQTSYTVFGNTILNGCSTRVSIPITVNPLPSINLSAQSGSSSQAVCKGSSIQPIEIEFGGGATGVTLTGALPNGITGMFVNGKYKISGIATNTGSFNYSVTTTGLCSQVSITGTITIRPAASIVNYTSVATTNQTLCVGAAMANIGYTIGDAATNATVSGLPLGVAWGRTGNLVAIWGNPSVAGSYTYTVTAVEPNNLCNASKQGTITVISIPTLTRTSAVGSNTQSRCLSNSAPITPITYQIGGGANGVTLSGSLPPGVTGTYSAATGTYTISGRPTQVGTFNFSVATTTPGNVCSQDSRNGTIMVNNCKVGLENETQHLEDQLTVFANPNPFSSQLNVLVIGAKSELVHVIVMDINGKIEYENIEFPVNVSTVIGDNLTSGLYFMKVIDVSDYKTLKILKIKE